MKEELNYKSVPSHFPHCFNNQCLKAENCLRNLAARNTTTEFPYINTVNPVCIPADTIHCTYFQSIQKMRVAWGITHLLDNVPHKNARELKDQLIGYFGRGKYYRFYRKECYLTPEDQTCIRRLFRQKGVQEELSFDSYSEEYKWW